MKIIIVGPAHPYRGGIAIFNETLAEHFTKEGHQVKIINFTLQYPSFLFPGKTQYTDAPAPTAFNIERRLNSINPISWISVAKQIKNEKPDMVILRYWMPFFAPSMGTIARRIKKYTSVIALTDNVIPHERRFFDNVFTRYFLKGVHAVVYMSRQVGNELDEFNFKGIKAFSPHPIYDTYGDSVSKEEACRQLGLDPKYNYSLFFGFIREYKGLDLLLEAWAELKIKKTQNLKLIVAGEYYGNKEHYTTLIDSLGLADEIIVHDNYIPENHVKYYFSASDLVIQPYKTATQSGVTQIAYHFNTPMIVTNVGGLSEIVPHQRVGYVIEQSPFELCRCIEDFYTNNRAEIFKQNIIEERKRFEWSELTDTFTSIHNNLKSNQ